MSEFGYNNGYYSVVYGMTGDGTKASDFLTMDPWFDDKYDPSDKENLNTLQSSIDYQKRNHTGVYIHAWRVYRPIE